MEDLAPFLEGAGSGSDLIFEEAIMAPCEGPLCGVLEGLLRGRFHPEMSGKWRVSIKGANALLFAG